MSEPVGREWRFYIDDMMAFAEKAVACTNGLDQQAFMASGLVYDDTLRPCELGTCAGFRRWAHDVSRRLPRARALRVASGVAGRVMRAKSPRNLLMFNRFPSAPFQYDIVLM